MTRTAARRGSDLFQMEAEKKNTVFKPEKGQTVTKLKSLDTHLTKFGKRGWNTERFLKDQTPPPQSFIAKQLVKCLMDHQSVHGCSEVKLDSCFLFPKVASEKVAMN